MIEVKPKLPQVPCPTVLSCYAPFPLAPSLVSRLSAAGIEPSLQQPSLADTTSLWIYDSPDRVLEQCHAHQPTPPEISHLVNSYRSLLGQPGEHVLISAWRLETIDPIDLKQWACGKQDLLRLAEGSVPQPPAIETLASQFVLGLLIETPSLLEIYLDLELQSELLGSNPDSHYLERLQNAATSSSLLGSWWNLMSCQGNPEALGLQLKEAEEESELTLLQLHQVQEELEHYFLEAMKLKAEKQELGARKRAEREQKEALDVELKELKKEKDGLGSMLINQRQLNTQLAAECKKKAKVIQLKEEECQAKDGKLAWLRSQRQLLIDLIKFQFNVFERFSILSPRFKLLRKPGQSPRQGSLAGLQGMLPSAASQALPRGDDF